MRTGKILREGWGVQRVNWARVGQINGENMDLTVGTQVRVSVTRQKCHHLRHKKILDGYDKFSTYDVVV